MRKCIVLGLQRSGTNFTETLIRENLEGINISNVKARYLWKHDYNFDLKLIEPNAVHIYITKNPYTWVQSIKRKKVDMLKKHDWMRGNSASKIIVNELDLEKLCKHWNDHTLWFSTDKVINKLNYHKVQYEYLIKDRNNLYDFLEKVSEKYNVNKKYNSNNINHPKKVSQSDEWTEDKRNKYVGINLDNIDWDEMQIINELISYEAFNFSGYKKINTIEEFNSKKKL